MSFAGHDFFLLLLPYHYCCKGIHEKTDDSRSWTVRDQASEHEVCLPRHFRRIQEPRFRGNLNL